MTSTLEAREHLVRAVEADLVGPFAGANASDTAEELLPLPPSRWYLTGFLAPFVARETDDPTEDDELAAGDDRDDEESGGPEPAPKQRNFFPASMGLSVLLPPGDGSDHIVARVTWADYVREDRAEDTGEERRRRTLWRRVPQPAAEVELPLEPEEIERGREIPGSGGVFVQGQLGDAEAPGLMPGTRALSLFVVNRREPGEKGRLDERFLFQVRLEVECARGLTPRSNRRDEVADEWDDRVADLQFRERFEWAVGHAVSVELPPQSDPVTRVRTAWIPRHEVRRVITNEEPGIETAMETLGEFADGAAAQAALRALPEAYAAWIAAQRQIDPGSDRRRETRDSLADQAERARRRIEEGIALLASDAEVFEAFCLANRAMAMAAKQRTPERYAVGGWPTWRLFQIAFFLLSLPSVADAGHPDRDDVELIFFPTGGGKTEAYLGVIAFALVLRRLRGRERPDGGLGVAVLLRYTLRLLTLDQLDRAATLICALERLRQAAPERLGEVRFAVGLWVGRTATANTLAQVSERITEYKNAASATAPSPFPLTACPWCREPLTRDSLVLVPSREAPRDVVVGCASFRCDFSARKNREGLPVLFVDEQIYRELPGFVVATVDKFAMLPWRGETGLLFGRASARDGRAFYGPLDRIPKPAKLLPEGLLPPELIVQDELHLISGPLGTMVGLYETAIHWLASGLGTAGGAERRPKILAATATVRRAREQVSCLFGRNRMAIFPPPGLEDSETWFASVDRDSPGRLYLGVAAQGRALKGILLRVYIALLTAAQHAYETLGPEAADPYMTLVGYFNSLRELGGTRRLVEDDVRTRCQKVVERHPEGAGDPHPWFAKRRVREEPVELTSREPMARVAASRARLSKLHQDDDHVDVLLASNMISVGLDIDRLGLMVVAGQPTTTSEYIQATSRVGRQPPGLVVTCYNNVRPRDRSHYERFVAYHESFYRFVEATSLTPFSGPALERGLAGVLLGMVRFSHPALTPAAGAMEIAAHRAAAERAVAELAERGGRQSHGRYEEVKPLLADRAQNLLDAWEGLVETAKTEAAARRSYSPYDRDRAAGRPLLYSSGDERRPEPGTDDAKFGAPTSMRDVEPNVHLWIERRALGGRR